MQGRICPYNRGGETQKYIQRDHIPENSDERDGYDYFLKVELSPAPCYGERCGAWRNGACRYAAVSLDNN